MTLSAQTSSTTEFAGGATLPPPAFRSGRTAYHDLPGKPDHEDLLHLQAFLADRRDVPVVISAVRLRRADTLLLQLLLAARKDWSERQVPFSVVDLPEPVAAALPVLGLRPDIIGAEDGQ